MKNYRHYIVIISALAITLGSIILGALISKTDAFTVNANAPSQIDYKRNRSGKISANLGVGVENNIGGSGDDTAVSAIAYGDSIYIFGNTNSTDYDLTDADGRAFVSLLSANLDTIDFAFLGNGDKIVSAVLGEGGLVVCFEQNGKITLRFYYFSLELLRSTRADGQSGISFCNLRYYDGNYYLITYQSVALNRKRIIFQAFDTALNLSYERIISSPFSLDFIDFFKIGDDFSLFMNCSSDLGSHLGVAQFNSSTAIKIDYIDEQADYFCSSVAPYAHGFVLPATYSNGDTGIVFISPDYDYQKFEKISTGNNAWLCYGGGIYYFFSLDKSGATYAINDDFTTVKHLSYLSSASDFYDHIGLDYGSIFCIEKDEIAVVQGSENSLYAPLTAPKSKPILLRAGNNFYCVYSSETPSLTHFGKSDIYIYKLLV
ncbi:MAG: hypothetical protein IJY70_02805 [Clostridia bacterium]|nr:hypothetical protein [Clostridia bacterium]